MGKRDTRVAFVNPIAAARAGGAVHVSGPSLRDYLNRPRPLWDELKEQIRMNRKKRSRTLEEFEANVNKKHRTTLERGRDREMKKRNKQSIKKRKYSVETAFKENIELIKERVDQESSEWYNVYEDGDLLVYRKDYEVDGIVCDPLKASHIIPCSSSSSSSPSSSSSSSSTTSRSESRKNKKLMKRKKKRKKEEKYENQRSSSSSSTSASSSSSSSISADRNQSRKYKGGDKRNRRTSSESEWEEVISSNIRKTKKRKKEKR